MLKNIVYKIFGSRNERLLKTYNATVSKINQLEDSILPLTDEQLKTKTEEFKSRYKNGETLQEILPEAFAVCREASKRVLNMRHFDVQLIGGIVLHDGKIAEMRTGEGKTLVATLAVYLNAISGNGVHVVTVNDYLARRDAMQMSVLYNFLGLSVGVIVANMDHTEKQEAYKSDVTYGTNNEFGFDYLRDNMVFDIKDKVQRDLNFAVVDEVDSILIDEARTPLIISGPAEASNELYMKLDLVSPMLVRQEKEDDENGDFFIDEKEHNVILSEKGHINVEEILSSMGLLKGDDSLYSVSNIGLMHHLLAALKAHYVYIKDQHYVIQEGEIVIVDEFTGRLMSGRRWSDGLHQAVEAKEKVEIQRENQTLASITFQNYFRMYGKLSGMTGTADTEAFEFNSIYKLETVVIPTNKPIVRLDYQDKIYMNLNDKYNAIIEEIKIAVSRSQPVLVGTTSVDNSELLSELLTKAGVKHEVLNAKQHAREADIIAQAGYPGNITVATNMAGRGTDIILGGSPKSKIELINHDENLTDAEKELAIAKINQEWQVLNKKVLDAGGLYIIGTERHESRRIDNQLRGRAGRQGDPGMSKFYLSLDDSLLRIFGGDKMRSMMSRLGMAPGESIEHKWLSKSIESAQKKVEGHNFDIRKQVLEYDDVSNEQRKIIYAQRNDILVDDKLSQVSKNTIETVLSQHLNLYLFDEVDISTWDVEALDKVLNNEFLLNISVATMLVNDHKAVKSEIKYAIIEQAVHNYLDKMDKFGKKVVLDIYNQIDQFIPDREDHSTWNVVAMDTFFDNNNFFLADSLTFGEYLEANPTISYQLFMEYVSAMLVGMNQFQINRFERSVVLQYLDHHWREHLTSLDHLRQGIGLRGYAQKDPKQEYKQESFALFSSMLDSIKNDICKTLLTVKLQSIDDVAAQEALAEMEMEEVEDSSENIDKPSNPYANMKIGRNDPCPCGSGQKYKHCHGKLN